MSTCENTLLIIKPKSFPNRNYILQLLKLNGFQITHRKTTWFSPEQAAEFYKDIEKTDEMFHIKVMTLSMGPSESIILQKVMAVNDLQALIKSLNPYQEFLNSEQDFAFHASASKASAINEIRLIFPNVVLEVSRRTYFGSYCSCKKMEKLLAKCIFHACQHKIKNPRMHLCNCLTKPEDYDQYCKN